MKSKILLLSLLTFPCLATAENPNANFDASHNMTNQTKIEWRQIKEIQKGCNDESKKRGLGGFKIAVDACSFWDKGVLGDYCLIITEPNTSMAILGHEVRHCFQGAFHK